MAIISGSYNPQKESPITEPLSVSLDGEFYNTDRPILKLFQEQGIDFVKKLNGMFALAIWDRLKAQLILVRDHMGIKPLYYTQEGDTLYFASELKTLLVLLDKTPVINPLALDEYLSLRFVPMPHTIFFGISKLPAGHYLVTDKRGIKIKKYWDFEFKPEELSEKEHIAKIEELLWDCVKKRIKNGELPAVALSGGLDSSTLLGIYANLTDERIKTFSAGFEEGGYFDESAFAAEVIKRYDTQHQKIVVRPQMVPEILSKLVYLFGEPMADPAAIATFLVAQKAKEKASAILIGEGPDELFSGYQRDLPNPLESFFKFLPQNFAQLFSNMVMKLPQTMRGRNILIRAPMSIEERAWHIVSCAFQDMDKKQIYSARFKKELGSSKSETVANYLGQAKNWDYLSKMLYLETKFGLTDDAFVKVNRIAEADSLIGRLPFADYRLFEQAAKISSSIKRKGGVSKYVLREAAKDVLPEMIYKRKKHAFDLPIGQWLRAELKGWLSEVLSKKELEKNGYFDADEVWKVINAHFIGKHDFSFEIWILLNFVLWHKIFIQGETR